MIVGGSVPSVVIFRYRPALYGAYHKIENLDGEGRELRLYDVAGPVCESADVLAEDRVLPETRRGDLIAIRSAGAYGSVTSSGYNMRTPAYAVFPIDATLAPLCAS